MDTAIKTLVEEALEAQENPKSTLPTHPPTGTPQPEMDILEERLFMQRQQHAFEMSVMRKRVKLAERQNTQTHRKNGDWVQRLEQDRRELRLELGRARSSLRYLEGRNQSLQQAMSLPWWCVIAKWKALRRWAAMSE